MFQVSLKPPLPVAEMLHLPDLLQLLQGGYVGTHLKIRPDLTQKQQMDQEQAPLQVS